MRVQELVGQSVCGTYIVERIVGNGTMGMVLKVRHERLPKRFAMKVLHRDLSEGPESFARFRREAEITSSLGHPNIVDVVDWNQLPDGTPFLVMEYLLGEDLHARLQRVGALPVPAVLELCRQVGSALSAAHKHGVVHRDLKPQNIFLCKEDRGDEEVEVAKVLDFGISKILGHKGTYTGAIRVMGTPLYMAPEQAMGFAANVDGRADQFALAAILYQALSGRLPFGGDSVVEIAMKVMNEDPPPLRELVPDLPPHVVLTIERGLSKEREARFPTISDFTRALLGTAARSLTPPLGGPMFPPANSRITEATAEPVPGPGPGLGLPPSAAPAFRPSLPPEAPPPDEEPPRLTHGPLLSARAQSGLTFAALVLLSALLSGVATRAAVRALWPPRTSIVAGSAHAAASVSRPVVQAPVAPPVTLRFTIAPPSAEIYLDGRRVGAEVRVPRSEIGLHLEVRAHGYQPQTEILVPQSDQRVLIRLGPLPERSPRPPH